MALTIVLALGALACGGVWYLTGMPGPRHRGPLGAPFGDERELADRLRAHVQRLAGDIGPRTAADASAQKQAMAYIEEHLRGSGYEVTRLPLDERRSALPNLEAVLPGTSPDAPMLVVGAHYDTVSASPGADDNASGVAVLLELARMLHGRPLARSIRFVAFAEEEQGLIGSRVYAGQLRARGAAVEAMLSLEMLGYFSDEAGSQRYPIGALSYLYPDRADFVAFVGNLRSRALVRTCVGTFRSAVQFPCEGMAAPEALRDIGRSDNAPFWQEGYAAVMVTDTSNFRNPHYHRSSDRPETLDFPRMARVTRGLAAVVERLGGADTDR